MRFNYYNLPDGISLSAKWVPTGSFLLRKEWTSYPCSVTDLRDF